MSNAQTQAVYKMIDNLTDTTSWADLAKELDKYATSAGDANADVAASGETIEMTDLMKSLVEKHRASGENR